MKGKITVECSITANSGGSSSTISNNTIGGSSDYPITTVGGNFSQEMLDELNGVIFMAPTNVVANQRTIRCDNPRPSSATGIKYCDYYPGPESGTPKSDCDDYTSLDVTGGSAQLEQDIIHPTTEQGTNCNPNDNCKAFIKLVIEKNGTQYPNCKLGN